MTPEQATELIKVLQELQQTIRNASYVLAFCMGSIAMSFMLFNFRDK